jgi:hypothetical protein
VDTDFTAKLIDVYPPSAWYPQGYALNLTDSIARLRYRNGRERGELVKPGEPVPVTITLYPTSNLFLPGHRIRLDVSSSHFPWFDVKSHTGRRSGGSGGRWWRTTPCSMSGDGSRGWCCRLFRLNPGKVDHEPGPGRGCLNTVAF